MSMVGMPNEPRMLLIGKRCVTISEIPQSQKKCAISGRRNTASNVGANKGISSSTCRNSMVTRRVQNNTGRLLKTPDLFITSGLLAIRRLSRQIVTQQVRSQLLKQLTCLRRIKATYHFQEHVQQPALL